MHVILPGLRALVLQAWVEPSPRRWLRVRLNRFACQSGQGTVEYLMMMAVVVGVILVIGRMFKPQVSGIFNQIMRMIADGVVTVGG